MTRIGEKLVVRACVLVVVLIAVATILIGLGNFTNLVAGLLIVAFIVVWVIAWRNGKETVKFLPRIMGGALVWLAGVLILFAWADTPPSTLESEPAGFVPSGTGRIAFVQDGGRVIYVMNADGTGKTPLTRNEYNASWPAWSPSGKQIAFSVKAGFFNFDEIYVMDADGTDPTRLTNSLAASNSHPIWSSDGRRIAFLSDRDSTWEAYVMNADGTHQTRLTQNFQNDQCTPAWSPDGKHLAFASRHSDGSPEIYVVNADGTDQIHMARQTGGRKWKQAWRAAWSPDGKQVAFLGKDGIYVMNADGTNRTRLTDSGLYNSGSLSCNDPVWSPDGQHIAFVSDGMNINMMNADGTNQTRLTDYRLSPSEKYAEIYDLIWSPDGKRIAYFASIGLYVMNVDGTNQTYLGSGDWPSWAP
jgi:Tol biopolymer transport system component